ncbi:hypothetical protein M405DRAFT_820625 [Rhizopogon salebrosus TDB-379]|nr:hypothetical protein M405DRAFT_820625 [Rhizopogon salebrosus TDB-379]
MAGVAAVSNQRNFSSEGYLYPDRADLEPIYPVGVNGPCTTTTRCDHPTGCIWYS